MFRLHCATGLDLVRLCCGQAKAASGKYPADVPDRHAHDERHVQKTVSSLSDPATQARQRWMGLLARSDGATLSALAARLAALPAHAVLRGPEPGLVMVRGRTGAVGAPFNLGEMTVTRCSVRISEGPAAGGVGHAYVCGRDNEKARIAACLDALLVAGAHTAEIEDMVLSPLERDEIARRTARAAKSAATKVDFFTMVRSEHGGRD